MTSNNAAKLKKATKTGNNGLPIRYQAYQQQPRQLLVNESILRRNQMYRQQHNQTTAIQTEGSITSKSNTPMIPKQANLSNFGATTVVNSRVQDPSTPGKTELSID